MHLCWSLYLQPPNAPHSLSCSSAHVWWDPKNEHYWRGMPCTWTAEQSVRLWCIWRLEVCMVVLRCALAFMCLWLLQCMPDKEGRHLYIDKETSAWLEDIGRGCTHNLWCVCVCSQAWPAYCGLSGEQWGVGVRKHMQNTICWPLMFLDLYTHTHQPWSGRDDLYSGPSGNKSSNSWTFGKHPNMVCIYIYICRMHLAHKCNV